MTLTVAKIDVLRGSLGALDPLKVGLIKIENLQNVLNLPDSEFLHLLISSGSAFVQYNTFLDFLCIGSINLSGWSAVGDQTNKNENDELKREVAELKIQNEQLKKEAVAIAQREQNREMSELQARIAELEAASAKTKEAEPARVLTAADQYNAAYAEVAESQCMRALESYKLQSLLIKSVVSENVKSGRQPWEQDPVYQGLEPHVLLRDASRINSTFVKACNDLKEVLVAEELSVSLLFGTIKGPVRANTKVNVKYGGNVCHLSDITRATLEIEAAGKDTLQRTYRALIKVVRFPKEGFQFVHFDDRFMKPMKGGYRDFLFLINVRGIDRKSVV